MTFFAIWKKLSENFSQSKILSDVIGEKNRHRLTKCKNAKGIFGYIIKKKKKAQNLHRQHQGRINHPKNEGFLFFLRGVNELLNE